jgi:hypothetical protein
MDIKSTLNVLNGHQTYIKCTHIKFTCKMHIGSRPLSSLSCGEGRGRREEVGGKREVGGRKTEDGGRRTEVEEKRTIEEVRGRGERWL